MNIGTKNDSSRIEQREVILSNKISLLLLPLTIIAISISYLNNVHSALFAFSSLFFVLICVFVLNKLNLNFIARLLLTIVPPVVLFYPFLMGQFNLDFKYHSLSYTFIGLAIIPLVLFIKKTDRIALFVSLLIHLSSLIYFDVLMGEVASDPIFYSVPQLVLWILIVAAFQFLKSEGHLVERSLKAANDALTHSNMEIQMQKEEIIAQNDFLHNNQLKIEEQASNLARSNNELTNTKVELLKMIDRLQDAKEKLLQKEAVTKSILNALNEHYFVAQYDMDGKLVRFNHKVAKLFSLIRPDMKEIRPINQKNGYDLSNSNSQDTFKKLWLEIVGGKALTLDIEIPFGEQAKYFSTTLAPLFDPKGNPYRVLAIGQDISELLDKQDKIDKINDELKEKIHEISEQNELLNFQQLEIFNQSEELRRQSEEIKAINESLEERVKERTQVLEEKNQQLAEYAFINSHVLRAPVSTMMGLINLISYTSLSVEDQKIYEHLLETANILDNIVYKINRAIDSGSHFDRNYIEPERDFHPMEH